MTPTFSLYLVDSVMASPKERYRIFRGHCGRLRAAACKVVGYSYFQDIFHLPPREDVLKAVKVLWDLSMLEAAENAISSARYDAIDAERDVRKLLRLETPR